MVTRGYGLPSSRDTGETFGMADRDVEGLMRWSLACMSLAAAVIHAQAAADHQGFPVQVGFFLAVAVVQSGLGAIVLRRPSVRWLAAIAAWNGAVAAVWVLSRTVGLPVGGATGVESIGFKDGIAVLLELGICAGAGLLGTLPEAARRVALDAGPLASTVMAATVWGLGVSALLASQAHDGHAQGGDVQAVAANLGPSSPAGSSHHNGDHGEPTTSVAQPEPDHGAGAPGTRERNADKGFGDHPAPAGAHQQGHAAVANRTSATHRHAASREAVNTDTGPAGHPDRTVQGHDSVPTRADDTAAGHGPAPNDHRDGQTPGDHPGAGERGPGDDRSGVGRLIDDVTRPLLRDLPTRSAVPLTTESEVPT